MAPWDILFAVKEADPVARIQAFIDGYKKIPNYEVQSYPRIEISFSYQEFMIFSINEDH
ncbi:hypothetical protein ONS96_008317 [Cadophora gregata f. sp. sojae]|nr:hypothetical protein ONS96_008317 [Cadophora gregata f. sp. sojae]